MVRWRSKFHIVPMVFVLPPLKGRIFDHLASEILRGTSWIQQNHAIFKCWITLTFWENFCKHFLWLVTCRHPFCSVVYLRCAVRSTATTLMRGTTFQQLNKGLGIQILHMSETDPRCSLTISEVTQLVQKVDLKRQRGWTIVEAASYSEGAERGRLLCMATPIIMT